MKPIKFPGYNIILAEDQPQYISLPVHRCNDSYGTCVCCWKLNFMERVKLLFTGKLYISQLTFHNPFSPLRPDVTNPVIQRERN